MVLGFIWNKEEQGTDADVEPKLANTTEENGADAGIQTELQLTTKMLLTAHWFGCFPEPERQRSKTSRIQYRLLSQPLLYLFTQLLGKPHNVCLTGWLQPVLNKERLRIASPVFKLLLGARCRNAIDIHSVLASVLETLHDSLNWPKSRAALQLERNRYLGLGIFVVSFPFAARSTTNDFADIAAKSEQTRTNI
jgi:hypothetical protein